MITFAQYILANCDPNRFNAHQQHLMAEGAYTGFPKAFKGVIFSSTRPEAGENVCGAWLTPEGELHDLRTSDVQHVSFLKNGGFGYRSEYVIETRNSIYKVVHVQ